MSLTVPAAVQEQAVRGEVPAEEFVVIVRDSLPYAYGLIADLVAELGASEREFADNLVAPPDERARGQLLRALASDSIRGVLEGHFGVRLAFQNCHRVGAFLPGEVGGEAYARFVSPRAQILNQTPEFRDC